MHVVFMLALLDGGTVNLKVPADAAWECRVGAFGTLKLPVKAVREITFGARADDPTPFERAAKALGDEKYGDRAAATKFLRENQRSAYRYIRLLPKGDLEVVTRVEQLLKDYQSFPPIHDVVVLEDGSRFNAAWLTLAEIEGVSDSLGRLKVKVSQIKGLTSRKSGKVVVPPNSDWVDVGSLPLAVSASGQVDLWAQSPGQYVTGPKGYATPGMGTNMPGCALIGRIGDGIPFVVGERWEGRGQGRLLLKVNASPWGGGTQTGSFEVVVE